VVPANDSSLEEINVIDTGIFLAHYCKYKIPKGFKFQLVKPSTTLDIILGSGMHPSGHPLEQLAHDGKIRGLVDWTGYPAASWKKQLPIHPFSNRELVAGSDLEPTTITSNHWQSLRTNAVSRFNSLWRLHNNMYAIGPYKKKKIPSRAQV